MFAYFANPARFERLARWITPLAAGVMVVAFTVGTWLSFWGSPADYQQGDSVRIMYVHVPAAWMAMMVYALMAVASFTGLVFRHALADVAARAAAPAGTVFTALALITGALWGKPMWGAYWVWDARLTSMLILLLFYIGYLALHAAIDDEMRAARAASVLCLVGAVNLPIIKFSVDWWNTLHQPASVFRAGGPSIHGSLLTPLFVMAVGYLALFAVVWLLSIRQALMARRLSNHLIRQAHGGAHG